MATVDIHDAHARLPEIISTLTPGEKLVIEQNGRPLAVLTRSPDGMQDRQPGSAAHLPHWMADDFDAPLEEFREYME
jgi:antitoxin (DNA-binding transcriptional repressor) of toxin-antitoxin stability system